MDAKKEFVIAWLNYELLMLKGKFLKDFKPHTEKDEEYRMALKELLRILEKKEQ